jgi:hypothetical protein
MARVAHIFMKGAETSRSNASAEGAATECIHVAADSKRRACDARDKLSEDIEFAYDRASHDSEHASESCTGWTPSECVHGDDSTDSFRHPGKSRKCGRTAEIMCDEREVPEIQCANYSLHRSGGAFHGHGGSRGIVGLTASRRIEENAAEVRREPCNEIPPDKRPRAYVYKQQHGALPDVGDRQQGAIRLNSETLKRPHAAR